MRYGLCALLLLGVACASPAQSKWLEASSDHFVIYSEQSEQSLREYATNLERFDKGMRHLQSVPVERLGPANRVTIYVVRNVAAVQKLFGKNARNIYGFYEGRATGSLAITPRRAGSGEFELNAMTVLLHEYAHHFMLQNYSAAIPAWFREGFAEFNSTAQFFDDGSVRFGAPAMHRAYGLFLTAMPLETLLDPTKVKLYPQQQDALYGRGWLLTHYLTFEPKRTGQLVGYLRRLNKGEKSLDAANAAFGDLRKLDAELERYLKRPRMSVVRLTPDKLPVGAVTIRSLTPGEEAMMPIRIRSQRGVTAEEARQLVVEARRAAAPFPADVAAQISLAEAEFDAGYHAEAEAAADRALGLDPKAINALIYKGRVRMAVATAARAVDESVWKDVRRFFVAANRIDPDDPEPLLLFYQSFHAQGIEPTANATIGLVRAQELAPQDDNVRMLLARQHLIDGKTTEARSKLAPLAYDPHGGKRAQAVSAIIAAIDAPGSKNALETWSKLQPSDQEDQD